MQTQPKTESKAMIWTGRVLSFLVIAFMALDAVMKLVPPPQVVEMTSKLGITGSTVTVLGAVLLVSTILYAIKKTAALGAILLTGYLGGAVAVNVTNHMPVFNICFSIFFGVIAWGGLYFRDEKIRNLIPLAN